MLSRKTTLKNGQTNYDLFRDVVVMIILSSYASRTVLLTSRKMRDHFQGKRPDHSTTRVLHSLSTDDHEELHLLARCSCLDRTSSTPNSSCM